MPQKLWTKEELLIVFNLYFKIPFGKMHSRTPEVIDVAELIGRSANAVAMRLGNFAHHDPYHQARGVKGLSGGVRQCQPIWDEYNADKDALLFQSEQLLAELKEEPLIAEHSVITKKAELAVGKDKSRLVKTRVNQSLFRQMIMSSYSSTCAISGIDIPELLFASHIIPWAKNEKERLNPSNGICLSATYDVAFDKGFIGVKPDYSIVVSKSILEHQTKEYYKQYFKGLDKIRLPERYEPKKEFLEWHLDNIFRG